MTDLRRRMLEALEQSYQSYRSHGARSSRKLLPLHRFLADEMAAIWGEDYQTHYLGEGRREFCVTGRYYNKNVDIVTVRNGAPVFGLGVKFVTSNYSQNSNNYFENMLGETANIQRMGIPYAQTIFLRDPMPYLKKGGELARIEKLSEHQLQKYIALAFDQSFPHRPFAMCIHLISINNEDEVSDASFDAKSHGKAFVELHEKHFSLESMLSKTHDFKIAREAGGFEANPNF